MAGYYLCLLAKLDSGPVKGISAQRTRRERFRIAGGSKEVWSRRAGARQFIQWAHRAIEENGREGSSGVRPGNPRVGVGKGREVREWIVRAEGD